MPEMCNTFRCITPIRAGLTLTDHHFKVPLDYLDESKGEIDLFVRIAMKQNHPENARLPCLLFLQGNPPFHHTLPIVVMHCAMGITSG